MRFPANRRISPGTSAIPPSTFRALRKSPSFVHSLNTIRHSSPAAVAAASPRSVSDYELKNHTIGNYHERTKAIGSSETRAAHGPDTAQTRPSPSWSNWLIRQLPGFRMASWAGMFSPSPSVPFGVPGSQAVGPVQRTVP